LESTLLASPQAFHVSFMEAAMAAFGLHTGQNAIIRPPLDR
jgi:hypothetical protein